MRPRVPERLGGLGWVLTLGWVVVVGGLVVGPAPDAAANEWTFHTGFHADVWTGGGQDGRQLLAPFGLAFDTPDWGASVRSAYGTSERDPGGDAPTASITGLTDTTLSAYLRFTLGETEFRAGLDVDLPTGVARLKTRDIPAAQDEDLVAVERFGEGLDFNPTVIAYRNFGAFGVGLGFAYLKTGEFDPTRDVANDDLDPGDQLTGALLVDLYATDTIRLLAGAAYTYFTPDERRGADVLREGDELDVRVVAEWRPEPWWLAVTLRDIVRFKAERADATGRLRTEPRNSNGNDFRAGVTAGYILNDAWSARIAADLRRVEANDYAADDPFHDGGRTKVAFGPSLTWSPSRTFAMDVGVRYFVLEAKQSPIFPRDTTIRGVHVDLRLTYRF